MERPDGRVADRDGGILDVTVDGFSPMDGEPLGDLENASGVWMLLMQDRICVLSGVGDPVDNVIWTRFLVQVEETGETPILRQKVRLCEQTLSPLPFDFVTVVPERLTRGLPELDVSGFLVNRELGGDYITEPFIDLWGAEGIGLDDPMPMSADDERVVDQDGDGEPGVSLTVTAADGSPICDVQVVQRTRIQFNGQVVSARRIEGDVDVLSAKTVLAASSPLCGGGEIASNRGRTFFKLVRVDGQYESPTADADGDGVIDCSDIRRNFSNIESVYGLELDVPDVNNCLAPAEEQSP